MSKRKRIRKPTHRVLELEEDSDDTNTPPLRATMRRGRGRGRSARYSSSRMQPSAQPEAANQLDIEDLRKQRMTTIKDTVAKMSEEEAKNLLIDAIDKSPSLYADVIHAPSSNPAPEPAPAATGDISWCSCNNCIVMPKIEEWVCCRRQPENCIAYSRDMEVAILDPLVLLVNRRYQQDMMATQMIDDRDENRQNRAAAYRSYALWTFGHLGGGNRKVLPSCVVTRIRRRYPDRDGQYTGFQWGRFM